MSALELSTGGESTAVAAASQIGVAASTDEQGVYSQDTSMKSPVKREPTLKKHKRYYLPEGNIVIQVESTLFRLNLSVLHENSPVLRSTIPPLQSGRVVPVVGFNERRPLLLREISEVDFVRLLSILYPQPSKGPKKFSTVDALLSVLRLATSFQMERVRNIAMAQLHDLPIDPIRKIAIWEEFHLDFDLLVPAFATLCQRSEPLTLPMTISLGIRNFTKVAASRDLYRQRVGCCGCRSSLSIEENQKIANDIVALVFPKRPLGPDKPLL